ncbi:MAG: hypothetical protein G01um101416_366 [Microgenomates group bacterium Gr01-1014_16]|nr:MAG: hypothetical protein G01um101416_366 [Microgenomates group bacterium Gr01-1014_16]
MADWFFVPCIGALREAHFRRPRAKREKKKSAGAEKKERPPERATEIKLLKEKTSATPKALVFVLIARGEEDTEWENIPDKTLARPPIGGPSECRGGSANSFQGWVGFVGSAESYQ